MARTVDERIEELRQMERVQPGTGEIILELHGQSAKRLFCEVEVQALALVVRIRPIASLERVWTESPAASISWGAYHQVWRVTFNRVGAEESFFASFVDAYKHALHHMSKLQGLPAISPKAWRALSALERNKPKSLIPSENVLRGQALFEFSHFADVEEEYEAHRRDFWSSGPDIDDIEDGVTNWQDETSHEASGEIW